MATAHKAYARQWRRHRDLTRERLSPKAVLRLLRGVCRVLGRKPPKVVFEEHRGWHYWDGEALHFDQSDLTPYIVAHELAHCLDESLGYTYHHHTRRHDLLTDLVAGLVRLLTKKKTMR